MIVVSREHARRGVEGGFVMANHGKKAPLSRMSAGDGLIVYSPRNTFPDGEPAHYPKVRALLRSGVGFDKLDLKAWGARGVPVFNVPDYGTSEVADHAIALMLSLVRGTATYNDAIRADPAGNWRAPIAPVVRRLRGQVFGVVGLGRIGLAAAEDTGRLVVRRIIAMGIDRRSAGLEPHPRRPPAVRDDFTDHASRFDSRLGNVPAVRHIVPAVHAAASEVDQDVGAFEFLGPSSRRPTIPCHVPPWRVTRIPAQHAHIMPTGMHRARQCVLGQRAEAGPPALGKAA